MSRAYFEFNETSPSAPGTAASSQAVLNAGNYFPAGVAGPMADYDAVDIIAELKGATGGTLDVTVQMSPNDSGAWFDIIHFTQLAGSAAAIIYQAPISNATTTTAPVVIGKNLSPALAAGVVVNGTFSDRLRLVMVAGSGTSAGAPVTVRVQPQRSETSRG